MSVATHLGHNAVLTAGALLLLWGLSIGRRRPAYEAYQRRTRSFIARPPREERA